MMFSPEQIWTGQRFIADDSAMPPVDRTDAPIRHLEVSGTVDQLTLRGLDLACRRAERDQAVKLVVISLDCLQSVWDVREGVHAIHRLIGSKPVAALVKNAHGSSLAMALITGNVFATACGRIGNLAAFTDDYGDAQSHSLATLDSLAGLRPGASASQWQHLLSNTIHGEVAETVGIVDGLAESVADVASQFTFVQEQR